MCYASVQTTKTVGGRQKRRGLGKGAVLPAAVLTVPDPAAVSGLRAFVLASPGAAAPASTSRHGLTSSGQGPASHLHSDRCP